MPFRIRVEIIARLCAARPLQHMVIAILLGFGSGTMATPVRASTDDSVPEYLSQLYARYLSEGRGDVEIHLSAAGTYASARTRALADGSFTCRVSGLRSHGSDANDRKGHLQLVALLVHEVTHCFVAPYLANVGDAAETSVAALAADRLTVLTVESISDARAVIEVFRRDGVESTQELVAMMLPQRTNPSSFGHSTALALHAALDQTRRRPESLHTPVQAFVAALEIGRRGALRTVANKLAADGHESLLNSAAFGRIRSALDAALVRAEHAFSHGRFTNNAISVRLTNDAVSPADHHVFIGVGGSLRTLPVISAEGAHSVLRLQTMIGSSESPEHMLAVQWLLRQGTLDTQSLPHLRQIMSRFMRAIGEGSDARRERVARVVGEAIENCRGNDDLSAVLDTAAEQLRAEVNR
jgi:hypothetical protein